MSKAYLVGKSIRFRGGEKILACLGTSLHCGGPDHSVTHLQEEESRKQTVKSHEKQFLLFQWEIDIQVHVVESQKSAYCGLRARSSECSQQPCNPFYKHSHKSAWRSA